MRHRFALPLLLLGLLTLPVAADPRPDILYTTRKEFVQVSPPRQLTLNANIYQFAYDPLGLEVACNAIDSPGEQYVYTIKTLDVRTGHELHRLTMSAPPDTNAQFNILGWTPSGKSLLLEQTRPREDKSGESVTELVRWDLSADPPKVQIVEPVFPLPEGTHLNDTLRVASPHRRRVLLVGSYSLEGKTHLAMLVYDAEQDSLRPLSRPEGFRIYESWTDDAHLVVRSETDKKKRQMDVVTGQLSDITKAADEDTAASRQFPDLTLLTDAKPQVDPSRSGAFDSTRLWVRCTPRFKQPLSAAGAGLTMSADDPQAGWSPTGRQIAYLNNGDLFVTDVDLVPASEVMGNEKYALDLPLTCPEEREIAKSNLEKIGQALMQYTQDNDEKFPPAAGIDDTLLPFVKSRLLYSVGAVHWVYHAPANLSFAAMDAPANVLIGTMMLPCGPEYLYADGHVKEIPPDRATPRPNNGEPEVRNWPVLYYPVPPLLGVRGPLSAFN